MPTCDRLHAECDEVLRLRPDLWDRYRGARLFVTGGTGFFGRSVLEVLLHANERFGLGLSLVLLTRDPASFTRRAPHLATDPAVTLHQGDVRTFTFPSGRADLVIHGAADADRAANIRDPLGMQATIVEGTDRVLRFSASAGCRQLLFVSSGAVYRPRIGGDGCGDGCDDDVSSEAAAEAAHATAKRMAELLCVLHARASGFEAKIARAFAFVGPYLPLDRHFAMGNFIRDVLAGRPIVVQGDGTALRSYLYSADMALWLLAILIDGAAGRPYNVGSDQAIAIADLARLVACRSGRSPDVEIRGRAVPGRPAERYVPCTSRAREELGLRVTVPLEEAIDRTLAWHRGGGQAAGSRRRNIGSEAL
jgi:nucleoside-diphosphate-sugar epimerase